MKWSLRLSLFSLLLALDVVPALAGEGFGILNKDHARMMRTHPPKVWVRGTRVAVRASGQTQELTDLAERVRSLTESELLGADPRLRSESDRPETIVDITVVQSEGNEAWENRTVMKQRKTGEKPDGKPIYQQYEDTVRYKIVTYRFNAAYKVRDARSNSNLDADTVSKSYRQEFSEGNGAPDLASLEEDGAKMVVATITRRIAPSKEQIGALVPRGSLKDYANLAEAGLWNQYLEALQSLPPLPKPKDDSYRQYGIGLGYEALGYAAETADETIRYLQQAAVSYNQALSMNPGEEYFSQPYKRRSFNLPFLQPTMGIVVRDEYPPPLARVKEALVDYQRIKEFEAETVQLAAGGKDLESVGGGSDSAPAADALTNSGVIEMVKAGLAEDIILTAINDAESVIFDVSPKGLIELSRAKVSKTIIQRLQARAANP